MAGEKKKYRVKDLIDEEEFVMAEEVKERLQLKYSVAEPGMMLVTHDDGSQTAFDKASFDKAYELAE